MRGQLHILLDAATAARRARITELVRAVEKHCSIEYKAENCLEPPEVWIADLKDTSAAWHWLRVLQSSASVVSTITLIDNPDPGWVRAALGAGVHAIINRDPESEELSLALDAAQAGLILLHPSSAQAFAATALPVTVPPNLEIEALTAREREVLRLIGDGLGNKEIAARLSISEHTAKFHISSILGKLNVSSRAEAVSQGIRRGLIPI